MHPCGFLLSVTLSASVCCVRSGPWNPREGRPSSYLPCTLRNLACAHLLGVSACCLMPHALRQSRYSAAGRRQDFRLPVPGFVASRRPHQQATSAINSCLCSSMLSAGGADSQGVGDTWPLPKADHCQAWTVIKPVSDARQYRVVMCVLHRVRLLWPHLPAGLLEYLDPRIETKGGEARRYPGKSDDF
jgi:hypothetical protein